MSFFDDAPEPEAFEGPDEQGYRSPPWFGPPDNEIGGTAPIDRVIVNTGEIAVAIGRLTAYTTGLELTLVVKQAPGTGDRRTGLVIVSRHFDDPVDGLRLGVGFSDGRKVIADTPGDGEAGSPVLSAHSSHGDDTVWSAEYWLWPLPPPGELTVAISWSKLGPEDRLVALDAGAILAAADRAVVLWPDGRPLVDDERLC